MDDSRYTRKTKTRTPLRQAMEHGLYSALTSLVQFPPQLRHAQCESAKKETIKAEVCLREILDPSHLSQQPAELGKTTTMLRDDVATGQLCNKYGARLD